jgi:NTE family protein
LIAARHALAALAAGVLCAPPAQALGVRFDHVPTGCPSSAPRAGEPLEPLPPMPHLGIALGSGSSHGAAHIGVIQELERGAIGVKVVAGTSVGAIIGALWASGLSAAEIATLQRDDDWEQLRFAYSRAGIFTNEPLRARLSKAFRDRPMESWPRRFGAVATDLLTGERVLFSRGDGAVAVQASTAIPALYAPVVFNGLTLGDGALVEPVPVDAARALGAAFVIAIDVAYRPREAQPQTTTQIAFQAMHILTNSLAAEQMKRADVAIRIDLHDTYMLCGPGAVVAAGRDALRAAWPVVIREARRWAAARR